MSRDPSAILARALTRSAAASGANVSVTPVSARDWSSATFTGTRHMLLLTAGSSPVTDAWLATLPDVDLPMPGQLLAELSMRPVGRRFHLDVLTLRTAE